jgi:MgtC family
VPVGYLEYVLDMNDRAESMNNNGSTARGLLSLYCGDKIMPTMDTLDIALRLGAATLVGIVLGLNRDLHGKPTGVRTLGVMCLGSALAVLSIHAVTDTDASRVIQGVVTGELFQSSGEIASAQFRPGPGPAGRWVSTSGS